MLEKVSDLVTQRGREGARNVTSSTLDRKGAAYANGTRLGCCLLASPLLAYHHGV